MDSQDLNAIAQELLAEASDHHSGRSARTVYGGREHTLRQTMIALVAGQALADHESPGEATLQVLAGQVRLTAGDDIWQGQAGGYVVIPQVRHRLDADADSVVLLSVATGTAAQ
ncbi:MAG: cupin domain-containing protein [Nocardioidaceae bacterium]|nr:MAG: cupin domain-containing protein [Nocardioidaceae bacterium]